jgi:hypothetical protein
MHILISNPKNGYYLWLKHCISSSYLLQGPTNLGVQSIISRSNSIAYLLPHQDAKHKRFLAIKMQSKKVVCLLL